MSDTDITAATRHTAYYNADAFLDAWAKGVGLAGPRFFGDGTREQLDHFTSKNDLAPRYDDIVAALDILSSGEAAFLVAMYSFYNSYATREMFDRVGVTGLAKLSQRLDETRLRLIAELLVSYEGW